MRSAQVLFAIGCGLLVPLFAVSCLPQVNSRLMSGEPEPAPAAGMHLLPAELDFPAETPLVPTLIPTWTPVPTKGGVGSAGLFEDINLLATPGSYYTTPAPLYQATAVPFSDGPLVIGYSTLGRPIEMYRFGTGPVKRVILAGIHGGYEWNTVALADRLIEYFTGSPREIPPSVTLYIVRNINPDGYAREFDGVNGRANASGVDLNRNFPVHWQEDWDRYGCWTYTPITGGVAPGSEIESQVVMAFLNEIRPTAIINYHSAALGIFPAANAEALEDWHIPSVALAEALAAVSTYPYPPVDTGCEYTGTLVDWAASIGAAAVDFELHTHSTTDFDEQRRVVQAFLTWRREE